MICRIRLLSVSFVAFAAVSVAAPASSQGVLSSPDDSGPSAFDYDGFAVVALISGIRKDTTGNQEAEVLCTNAGQSAVQWAVQVFDALDPLFCWTGISLLACAERR